MNRSYLFGILGLGVGIVGTLVVVPRTPLARFSGEPVAGPTPTPVPPEGPRAGPLLQGAAAPDLARRLDVLESQLARVLELLDGRAGTSPEPPTRAAPMSATHPLLMDPTGERLRSHWTTRLNEMEDQLRRVEAQGGGAADPVLDSHKDDVRRARGALDEAKDLEALERLMEGEFKRTFTLPK